MEPTRTYHFPDADQLTVVIRAAGERTEQLCTKIIQSQLPNESQLTVLHESPFSRAVIRTFEIGIESKRPWLIAIDADIIPLDDVLVRIREICGKMHPNAFVATPLFHCHAVNGLATRGLHCYNATHLPVAWSLISSLKENLRPESRFHDAMSAKGYSRECYAKIFGLHEHEQFAKHIYIKSMLRSRKDEFGAQIRASLESRAHTNRDCQIALWGFEDAQTDTTQPMEYDWDAPLPRFDARMKERGWNEQSAINLGTMSDLARQTINTHDYPNDTQTLPWIRDILDFEHGASQALAYVNGTPALSTMQPHHAHAATGES